MTKIVRSFMFVLVLISFVLAACAGPATEAPVVETTSAPAQSATLPAEDPMAMYALTPYLVTSSLPVRPLFFLLLNA
jgi:hypothetical protein